MSQVLFNLQTIRPRRRRLAPWMRQMTSETALLPRHLIQPIFICEGNEIQPIKSLPGVSRYPINALKDYIKSLIVPAIMLFPATPENLKDEQGTEALNPDNLICRAIKQIKECREDIGVITDVALDPYTSHGHDGLLKDGLILNDETVEVLQKQALLQAEAGADIIAPSDMMDGRVGAIRQALDDAGFQNTAIMSYAVKYASPLYGAFRDAVGSGQHLSGDKKTYQMDYRNTREALLEAMLDQQEAADFLIVKPGLPYLDIIAKLKQEALVPIVTYQVSGEYAMLKHAASAGAFDYQAALLESLYSFRRAGADSIISYAANDVALTL